MIPSCFIISFNFPSCIGGCPSASPGPPWPSCQKQEEETGPIAAIPGAGSDPDWGELSAEPWETLPATCTCGQWVGHYSPLRAQMQALPLQSHPEPLQGVGKLTPPPPQSHVTEKAWGGGIWPAPHQAKGNTPFPRSFICLSYFCTNDSFIFNSTSLPPFLKPAGSVYKPVSYCWLLPSFPVKGTKQ